MIDLILAFGGHYFTQLFFTCVAAMIVISAYIDLRDKNYPPGPFGTPIFGHLPMLNQRTPYTTLQDLAKHYGKVFSIYLGSVYTVVISDVKLIREALNLDTLNEKAPLILANGATRGKGILMADNDRWKQHRFFLHSTIKTLSSNTAGSGKFLLEDKIQVVLAEFLQDLKQSTENSHDVKPLLKHSIGSLMFDIVTGIRPNKGDPSWNKMQTALANQLQMMSITTSANFVPALRNFSSYTKALNLLISSGNEAKQLYKSCEQKYINNDSEDFLSIAEAYVTEAKRRQGKDTSFSADQVSQVLMDTLSMGWETTMNSIHWMFVYLAMHPEVQENILREIDYILGLKKDPLSLDDCKKLKYTEAVIMEVWRHRPILPMGVPHCATEGTMIGNYWIREGTLVVPLIYAVHRDQRYWDKPDDFIPERHLNDDGSIKKSDYYIPFQTGLRMCIGEDIAKWTVLLFLVGLVKSFKISFPTEVKYNQEDLPDFCVTSAPPSYKFTVESRC